MDTSPPGPATRLGPDFTRALDFAVRVHGDQVRKGTSITYVAHLLAVAATVLEHGGTQTEAIGGLLHDSAEDGEGEQTLAEVRDAFGDDVAAIVAGCSDTFASPKPPWLERKRRYIDGLGAHGPSVLLVSGADKLHNARSIVADHRTHGDALWQRFSATPQGTAWYYASLLEVYATSSMPPALVTELSVVIADLCDRAAGATPAAARQLPHDQLVRLRR